jgi:endonuclease/exonuclease/phosphatase (EEP) superfamily protein YafD
MTVRDMAHRVVDAIFWATLLASIPLVLGFFADWHPAFDSMGHFRAHLAVAVAAGGLILLATRFRGQALLAIALGAAAFWTTLPAFPIGGARGAAANENPGDQPVYRLLQLNLRFDNGAPERVLSLIGRIKPDVVTLEEVSVEWQPRLSLVSAMYPYSIVCTAPYRIGGAAILSRRPFVKATSGQCSNRGSLALADVDFGGRVLQVAALHLGWPWPFGQSRQLDRAERDLSALGKTTLLAGDLNAATWSATVRRIERDGALTHVAGIGPTWLDRRAPDMLRPYIGLPIDQVFSKGEIAILSARTLESVGSDHLPVLVEFSLTGDGAPDEPKTATALLSRQP